MPRKQSYTHHMTAIAAANQQHYAAREAYLLDRDWKHVPGPDGVWRWTFAIMPARNGVSGMVYMLALDDAISLQRYFDTTKSGKQRSV